MLKTVKGVSEAERIKKDIALFEESLLGVDSSLLDNEVKEVVDLAKSYYEDAKYYLEKRDYFTAFGCINYAHGLLDALKKTKGV